MISFLQISHLKLEDIPNETVEPLKTYTHEELDSHDIQHFQNKLHAAEEQLKAVKPNMSAIEVSACDFLCLEYFFCSENLIFWFK